MVATLIHSEGTVDEIKGGVITQVTGLPAKTTDHEEPAQQVIEPSPLADAAHVIENLEDGKAALSKLHALMLAEAMNCFQIGGTLLKMKENGWFGDHKSFDDMCGNDFGFKKSKAYYFIAIYKTLQNACMTWSDVQEIGWTKLRLICAKAVTAELEPGVFSTYVETVKSTKMTCPQVEALLKGDVSSVAEQKTTILMFKPHSDQLETIKAAIDKCKEKSGTEHDTVALEYVCLEYLSAGASQPKELAESPPVGGDVATQKPGEDGYVWPSMEQHYSHLFDKHCGDPAEAMKEVAPAFKAIFPNVNITVEILNEDIS